VRRHAVEPNGRKHQGDDAEETGEARHGTRLIERAIQLLLQGPDAPATRTSSPQLSVNGL
jgi:hypothetical protein